jgi:hypothetical protein
MSNIYLAAAFMVLVLTGAGCSAHGSARATDHSASGSGAASAAGHSGSGSGSVGK